MKKQDPKEKEIVTVEDVMEQYELLRVWHKTVCIAAIVLACCMVGFIVWGILFEPLRWFLIVFGAVLGICGAVMYLTIHRIYVKTSAAIKELIPQAKQKQDKTDGK